MLSVSGVWVQGPTSGANHDSADHLLPHRRRPFKRSDHPASSVECRHKDRCRTIRSEVRGSPTGRGLAKRGGCDKMNVGVQAGRRWQGYSTLDWDLAGYLPATWQQLMLSQLRQEPRGRLDRRFQPQE